MESTAAQFITKLMDLRRPEESTNTTIERSTHLAPKSSWAASGQEVLPCPETHRPVRGQVRASSERSGGLAWEREAKDRSAAAVLGDA